MATGQKEGLIMPTNGERVRLPLIIYIGMFLMLALVGGFAAFVGGQVVHAYLHPEPEPTRPAATAPSCRQ